MDVGSARGKFELTGLDKVITDLKTFRTDLKASNLDYVKHRKQQTLVVKSYAKYSTAIRTAIGSQKTYAGAIRATGVALVALERKQAKAAAAARASMKIGSQGLGLTASRAYGGMRDFTPSQTGIKAAQDYLAGARNVKLFDKAIIATKTSLSGVAVKLRASGTALKTFASKTLLAYKGLRRFLGVANQASARAGDWWHRFGLVAVGFSIAYRAINAVEAGIRQVTNAFVGGLKALDNYKQSLATISGMLGMLSTGGGGFSKRFDYFHKQMQGTMRESMRLAPMFRLSMNEISEAYKELAQFGVYTSQDMTRNTLTAIAAIKEIAVTTGSSTRQIRQEIQAVFSGQTRVTDQFGRFLKRFPELRKQLFGINKFATSNQEKWRLALEAISDYFKAIVEANKTVLSQLQITQNTLNIISLRALEMSGTYNTWLAQLTNFNGRLIKADGTLGDMGVKMLNIFGKGWYLIDKVGNLIFKFAVNLKRMGTSIKTAASDYSGLISQTFKFYMAMNLASFALGTVLRLGKFVVVFLTNPFVILVGALVLANSLMKEFAGISFTDLAKSFGTFYDKFTSFIDTYLPNFMRIMNPKNAGEGWKLLAKSAELFKRGYDTQTKTMILPNLPKTQKELKQLELDIIDYWARMKALSKAYTEDVEKKTSTGFSDRMHNVLKDSLNTITSTFDTLGKAVTGISNKDLKFNFPEFDPKKFKLQMDEIAAGLNGIKLGFDTTGDEIKEKAKAVYEYVGDSFGKFVGDTIRGEITSLEDVITGFLNMIRDAFANAFQDIANDMARTFMKNQFAGSSGNILNFLASPFGKTTAYSGPTPSGTIGSGGAWGGTATVALASGGMINEPVFGIGASGRTYTFAEKGPERVLSNKDSFGGSTGNVVVNVINKSSTPVDAKVGDTKRQLRNMVTEVILEDRRRGGVISRG